MKFTIACVRWDMPKIKKEEIPLRIHINLGTSVMFILFGSRGEPLTIGGVSAMPPEATIGMHLDKDKGAFVADSDIPPLRLIHRDEIKRILAHLIIVPLEYDDLDEDDVRDALKKLVKKVNKHFEDKKTAAIGMLVTANTSEYFTLETLKQKAEKEKKVLILEEFEI
jgi:hypothetical protein